MERRPRMTPDRERPPARHHRFAWRISGILILLALHVGFVPTASAQSQMTWALQVSLVPAWFDPGEFSPVQTSLVVMSALHDALVKPMPGQPLAPSLAESWQVSKDGLVYEFTLRSGVLFHNGERVTADDVKFSFDRYRGASAKLLKDRVATVEVVDPLHVRFRLKAPWPDFMTAYATPLTKAAWIVPKKYIEKVGDDGFKKAPVGAGPYRFVSYTPGVELVLDAHDRYWRKRPTVNRLVLRVVPDDATRLALLQRGDIDIAYSLRGPLGEGVKRTPGLKLSANLGGVAQWIDFGAQQWDSKSPWHDRRVRLAAAVAIDRNAINQAETLGFSRPSASIIPSRLEFAWSPPAYRYEPAQACKPRRGRLSQRIRCRRLQRRSVLRGFQRGRGERSQRSRHPYETAPDRASGVSLAVAGATISALARARGRRRVWQRGPAHRELHGPRWPLRVRQPP